MDQAVSFDYFYGGQSDTFSYYRIPRLLITGSQFKSLSTDAKLLYGLLLDRMGLSSRNGWYDGSGRVYIYYALEEIQRDLNCGHDKAVKLLAELDASKGVGLIERIRQGQGRPAKIYVKQFTTAEIPPQPVSSSPSAEPEPRLPESRSQDFEITETKTSKNQKSRLPENRSADFGKSEGNYNNIIKTNYLVIPGQKRSRCRSNRGIIDSPTPLFTPFCRFRYRSRGQIHSHQYPRTSSTNDPFLKWFSYASRMTRIAMSTSPF